MKLYKYVWLYRKTRDEDTKKGENENAIKIWREDPSREIETDKVMIE